MTSPGQSSEKPPGYADEDHGHWVMIPATLFTVVCPILFAVRIWARRSTTGVDLSDWLALIALVITYASVVSCSRLSTDQRAQRARYSRS